MNKFEFDNFHITSGGPGFGKSSLIAALAGRNIIQKQSRINSRALPWGDRAVFAELMLQWELRSYREAQDRTGPVLFRSGSAGHHRLPAAGQPESS